MPCFTLAVLTYLSLWIPLCNHTYTPYKRVKGRSHTVEKRKASQPQKPHATSQPERVLHQRRGRTHKYTITISPYNSTSHSSLLCHTLVVNTCLYIYVRHQRSRFIYPPSMPHNEIVTSTLTPETSSYKRVRGRSHTAEERISMQHRKVDVRIQHRHACPAHARMVHVTACHNYQHATPGPTQGSSVAVSATCDNVDQACPLRRHSSPAHEQLQFVRVRAKYVW